jgi:ferritin-like metal-binding protein YciE
MKNSVSYKFFLKFIQDIYDAEHQIVDRLPLMIKECTNEELKKGLTEHLIETKEQVNRLNKVFKLLGEEPSRKKCKGLEGIIEEGQSVLKEPGLTPAVKDCFIIITAQQIEHYEIASYGSAIALVEHFKSACSDKNEFSEICDLLNATIKEEGKADKKLTKVAEGKMFTEGVNDEIENEIKSMR